MFARRACSSRDRRLPDGTAVATILLKLLTLVLADRVLDDATTAFSEGGDAKYSSDLTKLLPNADASPEDDGCTAS